VMVRKRDAAAPATSLAAPEFAAAVPAASLVVPPGLALRHYDFALAGSARRWGDYAPGQRIDHVDGMTIEEAEHQLATRLYQNTARVHFNQFTEAQGRFGRRLVYGGHVIALARALSFNGLENAFRLAALNAGTHANPVFAGDTIFAWSEVKERIEVPGRTDLGALRLVTRAVKNRTTADFPDTGPDGKRLAEIVLELDYTVLMPR
jgi:2-methylfumaryl-CoA hydratase